MGGDTYRPYSKEPNHGDAFTPITISENGRSATYEWQVIQSETRLGLGAIEVRRPGGDKTTIRTTPDEQSMEIVAAHSRKGKGLSAAEATFVAQSVLQSKQAREEVRSAAGDLGGAMVKAMERFDRLMERRLGGGVIPPELSVKAPEEPSPGVRPPSSPADKTDDRIIVRPGLGGYIASNPKP